MCKTVEVVDLLHNHEILFIQVISIIIPTYNEQENIKRLLDYLVEFRKDDIELIVVDGGSSDLTVKTVGEYDNVRLIHSQKGRAIQMNAGWKASSGEYLFFLHADSTLPKGWYSAIQLAFRITNCVAGSFYLQFDINGFWFRLYSGLSKIKSPLVTFGDQGLFVKRAVFEQLDGFRELPILEDYDMIKRLRSMGKVIKLDLPMITSARKFQKNGVIYQQLKNISIVLLYKIGISSKRLAGWYMN